MSDYKDPVIEAVEDRLETTERYLERLEGDRDEHAKEVEKCSASIRQIEHEIAKMRGFLRVYNPEAPGSPKIYGPQPMLDYSGTVPAWMCAACGQAIVSGSLHTCGYATTLKTSNSNQI